MEEDYKLVGNDGLFQEYLEMGQLDLDNLSQLCYSSSVWFHYNICGGFSFGALICSPKQLG